MVDQETYEQYKMQEALQAQAGDAAIVQAAPQLYEHQQQIQSALVEQTNPSHVIKEIELSLMNKEEMPDGTIKKLGEPLMNDRGVNRMKFIMRSIINQNTILSHLKDAEINKLIMEKADNIIDDLTLNWKEYGISDKMMLDHIVDAVIMPAFFALKRALEQNEKNWLSRITVESVNSNPKLQQPKAGGFWNKFKM